jgi:hypothetical protein
MSSFSHPLLRRENLIELAIQSPLWVFFYATGLVFFMEVFAWIVYGLGWHINPERYPLPHVMVLSLLAERMRWLRSESDIAPRRRKLLLVVFSAVMLIGTPLVFVTYVKYLYWLWSGHPAFDVLRIFGE